jgi:hypothetical protein
MSEIDDPVKAALAAMENAMSVAAVAVQWHAKAEKHRVDEKEKNIAAENKVTNVNNTRKKIPTSPSTDNIAKNNDENIERRGYEGNNKIPHVLGAAKNNIQITSMPKKSLSTKKLNKTPPQTIKPNKDFSSNNILVTKDDYAPPKQEGERTVKLTDYQKKELLKQKDTLTRLKDEKSQILLLIRDLIFTDKATHTKIHEIEKEMQGLTNALTNLGAAAEVKGKITQKIESAEENSRQQLHYHKVLHLMTTRLTAEQKVLKSKIQALQLEETESKKELQQLELLKSRLQNTVQVAELELSQQQEISDAKISWQKESMRRINLQISDLEAMQKLRKESNQRIRDTQQQAKGDLSAEAEQALVQAATGSKFKASYLAVTNEAEKDRVRLFRANLAELKKITQKLTAKEILEYDKIMLKNKIKLPIVHKNLEDEIEKLELETNLIDDDVAFLNLKDHPRYEEMLDLEIKLYKSNRINLRQVTNEANHYKNIAVKLIRLLRMILTKLLRNSTDKVKNQVLVDASLLKNIIPPYTEEQLTVFFKLFDNVHVKEAYAKNLTLNNNSKAEINNRIDLLFDPAQKYNNTDKENENFSVIQSFIKLVRDRAKSILEELD